MKDTSQLFNKLATSLVPLQFFSVKKLALPKASLAVLFYAIAVIYVISLGSFVGVYTYLSQQSIQEVSIESSDLSSSGYSCTMASIVTSTIELKTDDDPNEYYDMINVNELGNQCVKDLQLANPCNSTFIYQPGYHNLRYDLPIFSSSAYPNSVIFLAVSSIDFSEYSDYVLDLYVFDYNEGQLEQSSFRIFQPSNIAVSSIIGVCSDGKVYFVNNVYGIISSFTNQGSSIEEYCPYPNCSSVALTNDNHYNLFLVGNFLNGTSTIFVSIGCSNDIRDNDIAFSEYLLLPFEIATIAVYNTSKSTTVFVSSFSNHPGVMYVKNGILGVVNSSVPLVSNMQVDSKGELLYVTYNGFFMDVYNVSDLVYDRVDGIIVPVSLGLGFSGGIGAFSVFTELNENLDSVLYTNSLTSYQPLKIIHLVELLAGTTESAAVVNEGYSGTTIGWFTCNSTILGVLPSNVNSAGTYCSSNGLSWQLSFEKDYYLTEGAMRQKAEKLANYYCNGSYVYDTICTKVGNQPPYICTQSIHTSPLQAFSSAIAASHFILGVLIFAGSWLFTFGSYRAGEGTQDKRNVEMDVINPVAETHY